MEKIKKVAMGITIVSAVLVSLYLILMLFGVKLFENYMLAFLVTFGGLAVGGFFAINSLNMVSKNKILGWVSFALIVLAVVLIDIMAWTTATSIMKITLSFGLLSVVFNIIVSMCLDLGKKYLPFQIVMYALSFVLDVIATLKIFDALPKGNGMGTTWFLALLIVDIVGLVILKVLSKKQVDKNMVYVNKEEYEMLKEKARKFDELGSKSEN